MIFECDIVHVCRRSRLGAWIEILPNDPVHRPCGVAPVWERGLKFAGLYPFSRSNSVAPVWERGLK